MVHISYSVLCMKPYIGRYVDEYLGSLLTELPAVLITGPRACGKTTTARQHAAEVVQLDRPDDAAFFQLNPDAALRGRAEPLLLDEWQEVPAVLGAVKRALDDDPRPGRFIITGSVRGRLQQQTWPGTGRLVHVPMWTLAEGEINGRGTPLLEQLSTGELQPSSNAGLDVKDYVTLATRGGFPDVLNVGELARRAWIDSYIEQLTDRDAPAITGVEGGRLREYLKAVAMNTAGLPAEATLAETAGINIATASRYNTLLADLGVVDRSGAWATNQLKRLTRRSKVYISDSGLAAGLAGMDVEAIMKSSDWIGRILDTLVAAQLRPLIAAARPSARLLHIRTEGGRQEIDLALERSAGSLIAFEVKAASAVRSRDARHLTWLRDELGDRFEAGLVLHTGRTAMQMSDRLWALPISALWNG